MNKNPLSEAEEMIGDLLFEMHINYEDQKEIRELKNDNKQYRIADFYLPKYKVYAEFLGDWDDPERRKAYKEKMAVYRANNIPCIYIWPNNLGALSWLLKERLRAALLEHKQYWPLFRFELKEFINETWIGLLFLITIAYAGKNNWLAIGIAVLIIFVCIIYCRYIRLKYKRIKKRHKLD